ncbi:MAG: tyrosine-type recombinase/integrase, partial [Planctomycetaceae bacterium]|nr:tyrosine-type recombinase/integrase [Planctomycetaceae bacterium]
LPKRCLDLETGWLEFPRPKTSVDRRIPLWPETVASLKEVLPLRPPAAEKDDDHLCFLTSNGTRFVRPVGRSRLDVLARNYDNLLRKLKLKRPGLSFYALRHTFETIAGETQDQVAVDAIMGHIDDSMASRYRQRISDERLIAVTNHVRKWLNSRTKTS